ncbi:GNAT family N-acetyltransferase [candidate division KSB1 bacterium]|nr:GNAT family N-acetyltransferase [candidate division KSB1 bacterium]
MTIRQYNESDREILMDITIRCFDSTSSIDHKIERLFGLIDGKDWAWRKKRNIDKDITENSVGIFVAEEENSPIGYVTTQIDPEIKIGSIPNLAVLPEHRKAGIGRALIDAAIGYIREQGLKLVRIETLDTNSVGKYFYPAYGFKEIARQIHYALPLDCT